MNNVMINNIPSMNRKNFGYKSINRSETHNDNQNEILSDILDLFNKANNIERTVNQNMEFIKHENSQLESINSMLLDKIEALKLNYEELYFDRQERRITVTPASCEIYDNTLGAVIDNKTSSITSRPSKKISKFAIFDDITDSMFLPNGLSVDITNKTDNGIVSQSDNDIYSPFYKDDNLYWTRRVVTDNTVEYIDTEYIITLPEEIMTTAEMNELLVHPFMSRVIAVYCRHGDSSLWESIAGQEHNPGISTNNDIDTLIRCQRPIRLNFPNKKINQLKIVIRCDNYVEGQTNLRTFMYGIKAIEGYINYYSNYENSSFQFEVTIPEPSIASDRYVITGIKPYFNNGTESGVYSKDFGYEIFFKDSNDIYHKITDSFPFTPTTNDLRIRCTFGQRYDEINIRKVEVIYKKLV